MSLKDLYTRARASGRLWNSLLIIFDACVVVVATTLAYYARFEGPPPEIFSRWVPHLIVASAVVYIAFLAVFGLYRLVLRFVGVDTMLRLLGAVAVGATLLGMADLLMPLEEHTRPVPLGVLFTQAIVVYVGAAAARLAARVFVYVRSIGGHAGRRVLIVGAGSAGSLLLREIQNRPDLGLSVVGFLDDQPQIHGRILAGVRVLGKPADLAEVVTRTRTEEVIVAMPSAPRETVRRILNAAADAGVETRVMPALVIAKGSVSLRDLRSVDVEDLLGRELTPIDVGQVRHTIEGKVVAVTGAAGSIGSELCRQVVRFGPQRLVLIEIDESRLYELWLELERAAPGVATMCLCDIRDAAKLDDVFASHKPDLVLHAAAYKHVPLMELAPAEAVKTNVMGTTQTIQACERHGVARFVLISTDKAVSPANIMGLTKALAERVTLDAVGRGKLNAVAVRFGNVLGSRGSVVPIFEEQLHHGGPLTVTHPDVTRYFMTIPEAARLVLQAQAIGRPGDVFVLEMGDPVRIVDLARKMIALAGVPADITFVGLRPGEKLHEELVTTAERLVPTERDKILRIDRGDAPANGGQAGLAELIAAANAGDAEALRLAIETIEPGFFSGGTALNKGQPASPLA